MLFSVKKYPLGLKERVSSYLTHLTYVTLGYIQLLEDNKDFRSLKVRNNGVVYKKNES